MAIGWQRIVPPVVTAAGLASSLYLLDWRQLSIGDGSSIRVSPTGVHGCSTSGECIDGADLGFDHDHVLRQMDGPAFATLMHAVFWAAIIAVLGQILLGVLAAIDAPDRWWFRIPATLTSAIVLVIAGVIAYGIVRQPSGETCAGLWVAIAAALVGSIAPLLRKPG